MQSASSNLFAETQTTESEKLEFAYALPAFPHHQPQQLGYQQQYYQDWQYQQYLQQQNIQRQTPCPCPVGYHLDGPCFQPPSAPSGENDVDDAVSTSSTKY
eukprot:GHVP01049906.1.p1 GENE.GHVP01049906.1~~GHVP01049906.1.p1  ORF type:complete len:101 (-),score=14.16 GHVP01049906.1:234-536(-)